MSIPLKINFRDMEPSIAIEDAIRGKADKLATFCEHLLACRVTVNPTPHHSRKGNDYEVRINLTVPGTELMINRSPRRLVHMRGSDETSEKIATPKHELTRRAAHADVYVAIRDAFNAAGRKLQDYEHHRRGKAKHHEGTPEARVAKIFPVADHGFLKTADGREIYFHKNSVLPPGFDMLEVGAPVYYIEEPGDEGPQATTVRLAR